VAQEHQHVLREVRNPETDENMTAVSSGCTNKDDSVRWAEKKLRDGTFDTKKVLFKDYVVGFLDRKGRYAQGRIVRNKSIASGTLDTSESNTRNHLVPKWGDYRINAITTGMIDSWVIDLPQQGVLSPNTINKIIQKLRTILSQAVRDGFWPNSTRYTINLLTRRQPGCGSPRCVGFVLTR
jgi:hypothetical protein